jgi:hypothetical protein
MKNNDDMDLMSIEQLHKVVLQLSSNCFELKKLCATILISAATLFATFSGWRLNYSIFNSGFVVTLFFWILDAQSYYYQEKLRSRMKILAERILRRRSSGSHLEIDGVGAVLTEQRENLKYYQRVLHSLFNKSMVFYWLVMILLSILSILFYSGIITNLSPQIPTR